MSSRITVRHPLPWDDPDFYRRDLLEEEMNRVFDICHGCRRCFNLCDSFPRLFDLIDQSPSGELDTVDPQDLGAVVDACTLCDMCFTQKCPYVPPHAFDIDFPHLMLRARAIEHQEGKGSWVQGQMAQTDRNGRLASKVAPVANTVLESKSTLSRAVLEKTTGIDRRAELPPFASKPLTQQPDSDALVPGDPEGPCKDQKAVLYATCFGNYHTPELALMAQKVLAHNGVSTRILYPECCGMPLWEQGQVVSVAEKALKISSVLKPYVDEGYAIITLVPSCTLMMKTEWPLLWPENPDIRALSQATYDVSDYGVMMADRYGLRPLASQEASISFHAACHARAQNRGHKGAELLRKIPGVTVHVIERCSGHGGSWGFMKDHFDTALKVGAPVVRQVEQQKADYLISECPLAGAHIQQGLTSCRNSQEDVHSPHHLLHPIQLLAQAYGF